MKIFNWGKIVQSTRRFFKKLLISGGGHGGFLKSGRVIPLTRNLSYRNEEFHKSFQIKQKFRYLSCNGLSFSRTGKKFEIELVYCMYHIFDFIGHAIFC